MNRHHHRRKAQGCPTGKKRFRDHRECVGWLHHAAKARIRAQHDAVTSDHRAVRSYECALCHGFHVTSQVRSA